MPEAEPSKEITRPGAQALNAGRSGDAFSDATGVLPIKTDAITAARIFAVRMGLVWAQSSAGNFCQIDEQPVSGMPGDPANALPRFCFSFEPWPSFENDAVTSRLSDQEPHGCADGNPECRRGEDNNDDRSINSVYGAFYFGCALRIFHHRMILPRTMSWN
jgi:hypothetical protein